MNCTSTTVSGVQWTGIIWLALLGLLSALVWMGCTSPVATALEPDGPTYRLRLPPSPTATSEPAPVGEAATMPEATSTAAGEATGSAEAEQAVLARPSPPAVASVPTPAREATPPASAEVGSPSPSAPLAASAASLRPLPIPLHPFQPAEKRARVVALDPGHGGSEVGAAGGGVAEKAVNLEIAFKLRALLEEDGMRVVLTRDGDRRATTGEEPSGYSATRLDLQARVDIANEARADVFISIHNNGSGDPGQSGTEVWYDGKRPFAAFNRAMAEQMLPALVDAIRATGYPVVNRGLKEDSNFRTFGGRVFPIFVLGPPRTGAATSRATQMPAILGETLFLSHSTEARLLGRDEVLTAIAEGYRTGLERYFQLIDGGALTLPPQGIPPEVPNYFNLPLPVPGGR